MLKDNLGVAVEVKGSFIDSLKPDQTFFFSHDLNEQYYCSDYSLFWATCPMAGNTVTTLALSVPWSLVVM